VFIASITVHNFRSIAHQTIKFQKYTTLIGPNNSGKSNIIAALLFFYDEIKLKESDFFECKECKEKELYVDVEFKEIPDEIYKSLPDQYKLPGDRMKVRRLAKIGGKAVYKGFTIKNGEEVLHDSDFFGTKRVGKGKLGDVIYIPALKNVVEELKTTGSSTMSKLLKEIVGPNIRESKEYEDFSNAVRNLSEKIKGEPVDNIKEWDFKSMAGVECYLRKELEPWNCKVQIGMEPLDPAKLAQQTVTVFIEEQGHLPFPVESKGQGLQRSLEVALVKLWSEVERKKARDKVAGAKKKVFHPEYTLLLIEEPETFQHPQQQYKFYEDLREISEGEHHQVIATTHSPYFLTPHTEDLSSIVKVVKQDNKTRTVTLSDDFLKKLPSDIEKKGFYFTLWLNPDRNVLFFSDLVILVEGQTEKVLFNWLINDYAALSPSQRGKCFVADCGGKFNIDKFMMLLGQFEIPHLVVHDKDNENKETHRKVNMRIQECRNEYTKEIIVIAPDLERRLGISLPSRASEKPAVMRDWIASEQYIDNLEIDMLCKVIKRHISEI